MPDQSPLTAEFEQHRRRLFAIAYRMLGSRADAEDMVQDAYLRWHATERAGVRSPEAWLVTVVSRLCIDRLRTAAVERAAYTGPWLPEPLIAHSPPPPDQHAELASSLSMAFLVLLERLGAEERAAFLLHDIFDCGYDDIAGILDKEESACRQLVHRARERVRAGRPRFEASAEARTRLIAQFTAAIAAGDEQQLLSLFTPDATMTSDGGGKVAAALNVVRGAEHVARFFIGVARKARGQISRVVPTIINGESGLVAIVAGRPYTFSFDIADDRIRAVFLVVNPDKLKGLQETPPC